MFLLLASAGAALAQTNPPVRQLSLQDCIELALHHNLDVQIQRFNPEISLYTLNGQYGAYDPTISLSAEHDYNQSAGGIDPQGRTFGGTETEVDRFSAGLSGTLPWGTVYNLGASLLDTYGNRPGTVTTSRLVPCGWTCAPELPVPLTRDWMTEMAAFISSLDGAFPFWV